jgi:hypothetical protein
MFTFRRLAKLSPALALVALAVPSSAFGQATRTWVSGVGDDANPCSRTAPCKTFAGAISKTAAGGEINTLDGGGFGAVTITKSITIKNEGGFTAGVLVANTNAIVISAGVADKVTLKGLDINGVGVTPPQTSLTGVKVLQAKTVHIINSEIYKFQAGVAVVPSGANTRVLISHSHIHDNGVGVFDGPGTAGGTNAITTVRDSLIADNVCGTAASAFGANGGTPNAATDCGAAPASSGLNNVAQILLSHNLVNDNGQGVYVRGGNATSEISYNEITANTVFGLHRVDGGHIKTFTPGTNTLSDNAATDQPDLSGPLTKRHAKRGR